MSSHSKQVRTHSEFDTRSERERDAALQSERARQITDPSRSEGGGQGNVFIWTGLYEPICCTRVPFVNVLHKMAQKLDSIGHGRTCGARPECQMTQSSSSCIGLLHRQLQWHWRSFCFTFETRSMTCFAVSREYWACQPGCQPECMLEEF